MDIQNTTNQHMLNLNTGKPNIPSPLIPNQNVQKPLIPLPSSGQDGKNTENAGQETADPAASGDSGFAAMEASLEEIRSGEMILNAALAAEAERAKYQKQEDRAELESTKERDTKSPDEEVASERIMERKMSELLHWKYNTRLSLEGNFNNIQSIFQSLLNDILSDYKGSLQLQMMAQLDAFALNAIRLMINEKLQDLLIFLEQYGRPNSEETLVNGLFENMSSRKPLTLQNQESALGGTGFSSQGLGQNGANRQMTQGLIYQKDAKSRINAQYQTYVGKSEKSGTSAAELLQRGGYITGGKAFSLHDIKQAQIFIRYLTQSLARPDADKLPYTSEEYLGFSAGMSSLKAQTFIGQAGLGDGTASALKYAMGTFVQEYFFQNSQDLKMTSSFKNSGSSPAYQADSFQKIYRYMIDSYNQKPDAQNAALTGLKKSLEIFYAKQADPVFQNMNRYRSDIGFFSHSPISDMKNELIKGWQAVCKDWNAFLQYMQLSKNRAVKFDYTLSRDYYMSLLMSQEKNSHNGKTKKRQAFQFMVRLAVLAIGIILCLFIMALFAP